MKKYIIIILLAILQQSCSNKSEVKNNEADLLSQKEIVEKQIDSLNRILIGIDQQLQLKEGEEAPAISALIIKPKPFVHYIELQGNIDTDGNVMVVPEVMASVKHIYKNEGDKVRKGQVILALDDSVLRNQIAEVQTQYSLAKTAFDRQKKLWDQKIGSEMAFLQAKTNKEALENKLKTLQSQLSKYKVKASINGTLDDLMIKEGEMAGPQLPVARLVNLDKVYVQADVSEKYLPYIKKGTPVDIDFSEIGKTANAKINYVGNFIHPTNRTFKVRVNLKNSDGLLKPNLTGNLKIKDYEAQKAIVLPLSIVQEDRHGNNFVYVLLPVPEEKDVYTVKKRIIELGKTYKNEVEVLSGLKEGEIIASQVTARGLTEGDKVKIEQVNTTDK